MGADGHLHGGEAVVVKGGTSDWRSVHVLLGSSAEVMPLSLRATDLLTTAPAGSPAGAPSLEGAAIDVAVLRVLVAKGGEAARSAVAVVCPVNRVDIAVADANAPDDVVRAVRV